MNWSGLLMGIGTILIVAWSHTLCITGVYHLGKRCAHLFFVLGILCVGLALWIPHLLLASLCSVQGFCFFWGIKEVPQQIKRQEQGWYPIKPTDANKCSLQ